MVQARQKYEAGGQQAIIFSNIQLFMIKTVEHMEGIDFNIIKGMDEQQAKDWFKGTDPVTRDDFSGATMQEMADFGKFQTKK